MNARDRLILSLDLPSLEAAEAMVAKLGDSITFYKVGYQIGFAGGLALARRLMDGGKQMFLDFKLHDIANTVQKGVESMAKTGATFATVHAYPRTMQAAVAGKKGTALKILAVTVLTSFDDNDLVEAGYGIKVSDLVAKRARQARDLGIDGLVCSGEEAVNLRNIVGPNVALVVPGIRPAGAAAGDQKRVMTPGKAIAAGADYLVVGRPIVDAADPKAAADAIVAEIEQAQSKRGK